MPANGLRGAVAIHPLRRRVPAHDHTVRRNAEERVSRGLHDCRQVVPDVVGAHGAILTAADGCALHERRRLSFLSMFSLRNCVELPLPLMACAGVAFVFGLHLGIGIGVLATAGVLAMMMVSLSVNTALAPRGPGVRAVTSGPFHDRLRALAEHARVHAPRLYVSARLPGPYAVKGAGPKDTIILIRRVRDRSAGSSGARRRRHLAPGGR